MDLLALEFALAADLVRTAVAPTWDDISKLAVIATIRTMLNYFLAKDIAEFEQAPKRAEISRWTSPPPNRLDRRGIMCLSESGPPLRDQTAGFWGGFGIARGRNRHGFN